MPDADFPCNMRMYWGNRPRGIWYGGWVELGLLTKESVMKYAGILLFGCMMMVGCFCANGETTVTLPAGADEHFTVQDADSNTVLRVEDEAVLVGSGVPIGAQSGALNFVISNEVQMTLSSAFGMGNLIVGSNTYSSIWGCELFGYENTMQFAANASILGGRDNNISAGNCRGSYSMPYFSVVAGGQHNEIIGSQSSTIAGGGHNIITNAGIGAVIIGGFNNKVTESCGTVLAGQYNHASGTNALAAGYYARALHNGSFVWADYSEASAFASSNDNEFAVRATGGVRFESELGADPLPNKKSRYGDNNIVAWARVGSGGGIAANHFGVLSCSTYSQGQYDIHLDVNMASSSTLIPVASVDLFGMAAPTNAAQARLIYVERTTDPNRFIVRTTTGNYVPTNTPFNFIVTGR